MRMSASSATFRASATEAFAGLGPGAVAPRGGVLRALALGLDLDQLQPARTRPDDGAVELAGAGVGVGQPDGEDLQPLAPERRPRPTEPHEAVQLGGRPIPVELELG